MSEAALAIPGLITTVAVTGGGMSGALHASRRNMDLVGIAFVAVCTGVGGGAIRDVLLGNSVPIFLIQPYLAMALIGAIAGVFFARLVRRLGPAIYIIDSVLIGAWVVMGAEKALRLDLSASAAVFLGVTTAVAGGIVRDVLCRETPTALMPGQWVAAAAVLSSLVFVIMDSATDNRILAQALAIAIATGLRMASAQFDWVTPDAMTMSKHLNRWLGLIKEPPEIYRRQR
jgi:uncharacterized membrane protein YeiH